MNRRPRRDPRREPDEREFQSQFIRYARSMPQDNRHAIYLKESQFFDEVPLFYDQRKTISARDVLTPDYRADIVELDKHGSLHLWEAKVLHCDDLIRGKVVGQLVFYDWLFSSAASSTVVSALRKKGMAEVDCRRLARRSHLKFKTWNILVCGGDGWELAAGHNPIMWTYPPLKEYYFQDDKPEINVYHFYACSTGYDLRHLFELSIFFPENMHGEAYSAFLQAERRTKAEWSAAIKAIQDNENLASSIQEMLDPPRFLNMLGRAEKVRRAKQ